MAAFDNIGLTGKFGGREIVHFRSLHGGAGSNDADFNLEPETMMAPKKRFMWWLIIPGILVWLLAALLIFGWSQPVKHSVTRRLALKQKPEAGKSDNRSHRWKFTR